MKTKKVLLAFALLCTSSPAHASAQLDALWQQGKWAAAAAQAADEKDFQTAALALHRLQECPSPTQPKGESRDVKLSIQGAAYARAALNNAQNKADKVEAYTHLGNLVGLQSYALSQGGISTTNMREGLNLARQSKAAYDAALQLDPNDPLLTSFYALWHARGYLRAGVVIGASLSEARHWLFVSQKAFNEMPEQTPAQVVNKAWVAFRIGGALESLRDTKMQPYFEAAIKLGDRVGTAEGRCAANVARIHMGRPITTF